MHVTELDGELLSLAPPYYVRMSEKGYWEHCEKKDAQAIALHNEHYAIDPDIPVPLPPLYDEDGEIIEDGRTAPVVTIYEVPDGTYTMDLLQTAVGLEAGILDTADAVAEATGGTEAALMDVADQLAELTARVEELEV